MANNNTPDSLGRDRTRAEAEYVGEHDGRPTYEYRVQVGYDMPDDECREYWALKATEDNYEHAGVHRPVINVVSGGTVAFKVVYGPVKRTVPDVQHRTWWVAPDLTDDEAVASMIAGMEVEGLVPADGLLNDQPAHAVYYCMPNLFGKNKPAEEAKLVHGGYCNKAEYDYWINNVREGGQP